MKNYINKFLLKYLKTIGLWLVIINSSSASMAAEFFYEKVSKDNPAHSLSIRGVLKKGDYEKFKDFLLESNNLSAFTIRIFLNSPGGDVVESLKFANLFERSSASTIIGAYSKCYSACFIMFAGGVDRSVMPVAELGVHRISLANLENDLRRAKDLINPLAINVYDYLLQQGIPRAILDKMSETPASDLYIIDNAIIKKNDWRRSLNSNPIFYDTVVKACGKFPDKYPGKSLSEQPRDLEDIESMQSWVRCQIDIQLSNTHDFIYTELAKIKAGKPSILFSIGKLREATLAVDSLTSR